MALEVISEVTFARFGLEMMPDGFDCEEGLLVFLLLLLSFSFSLPLESYYVTGFSHSPPTTSTDFTFCYRFPELHCPRLVFPLRFLWASAPF